MSTFYYRFTLLLFTGFLCTCVRAQQTVLHQGFEAADEGSHIFSTSTPPYGNGGLPTWNAVTRIKGIESASEGSFFWACRDARNALSDSTSTTLTFDAGDICALTSARFVFDYRVVGYDGGDDFGYELYLDGFLASRVLVLEGLNGGGRSTPGWVSDTVSVPGRARTARLVFFFDQNGDDVAGIDNLRLIATGSDGSCDQICGIRLKDPTVNCVDFTDFADGLTLSLPYSGAETGAVVSMEGASIAGDDPATVADGRIEISGMVEGNDYLLKIDGGDCNITMPLAYPADQCAPSFVVINEVLAAPGEDVNGDGKIDPSDEFVEIYNNGTDPVDLSGHTLHDASNSGARYTFPAGATLEAASRFTVFAGDGNFDTDCAYGIANGFLGLNDNTPESVTLRNGSGRIVARAAFDDAPAGESLVLYPDGNLAGGYYRHTAVSKLTSSPCVQDAAMPVDLLYFIAEPHGAAVKLSWATSRETDNERFVVERSRDGVSFREIGARIAGSGTYVLVDEAPHPGQNLYLLRQIDFDGATMTYGPVEVTLEAGPIKLYPNPTTGRLIVSGDTGAFESISVCGSDGRELLRTDERDFDVAHLPAGSYYLRLRGMSGTQSLRFIKE